eukprot:4288928-Heterocapsa_arctica.AAC.1
MKERIELAVVRARPELAGFLSLDGSGAYCEFLAYALASDDQALPSLSVAVHDGVTGTVQIFVGYGHPLLADD